MCANLPFGQSFGTLESGYYSLEQEPCETYSLVQQALFLLAVKRQANDASGSRKSSRHWHAVAGVLDGKHTEARIVRRLKLSPMFAYEM